MRPLDDAHGTKTHQLGHPIHRPPQRVGKDGPLKAQSGPLIGGGEGNLDEKATYLKPSQQYAKFPNKLQCPLIDI